MSLHNLKPAEQSNLNAGKRVGRGQGTGTVSYTHLTLPTNREV